MAEPRCSKFFAQFESQLFLNCSSLHHVNYHRKHFGNPNRVFAAGRRQVKCTKSVLKHSFAQDIFVTLLQHRVVFFDKNLQLHLHLKPSLNCSYLVRNFWANLSLVVLIKLFLKKEACTILAGQDSGYLIWFSAKGNKRIPNGDNLFENVLRTFEAEILKIFKIIQSQLKN